MPNSFASWPQKRARIQVHWRLPASRLRLQNQTPGAIAATALTLYTPGYRGSFIVMNFAAFPIAFAGFSGSELLIVLAIILVLFGGTRLPSLARGLGQAIREFKKASNDEPENKPSAETETGKAGEAKKPGNDAPTHGAN